MTYSWEIMSQSWLDLVETGNPPAASPGDVHHWRTCAFSFQGSGPGVKAGNRERGAGWMVNGGVAHQETKGEAARGGWVIVGHTAWFNRRAERNPSRHCFAGFPFLDVLRKHPSVSRRPQTLPASSRLCNFVQVREQELMNESACLRQVYFAISALERQENALKITIEETIESQFSSLRRSIWSFKSIMY